MGEQSRGAGLRSTSDVGVIWRSRTIWHIGYTPLLFSRGITFDDFDSASASFFSSQFIWNEAMAQMK